MSCKLVILVPFGRKAEVQCLLEHLKRLVRAHATPPQSFAIASIILWGNTQNEHDLAYLDQLSRELPSPFEIRRGGPGQCQFIFTMYRQIKRAFPNDDVFLVKVDDDVVYFGDQAISNLVRFALQNRNLYTCFGGNVINSGPLDHLHQRLGASSLRLILPYGHDVSLAAVQQVHDSFLAAVAANELMKYHFGQHIYFSYERWSINVVGFFLSHLTDANFDRIESIGDETFLTEEYGRDRGLYPVSVGDCLAVHYMLTQQRDAGYDQDRFRLNQFRALAGLEAVSG